MSKTLPTAVKSATKISNFAKYNPSARVCVKLVNYNYRPNEYSTIADTIFFVMASLSLRTDHANAISSLDEVLGIIMKLDHDEKEVRKKAIEEWEAKDNE